MEDRSAMLSNRICSLLDRVAILALVDSTRPCRPLDESFQRLIFLQSHPDPYDTCREMWGRLKRTLEEHTPPSLLCPCHCPTAQSHHLGLKHLKLRKGESPFIEAGPSPGSTRSTWTSAESTRRACPTACTTSSSGSGRW